MDKKDIIERIKKNEKIVEVMKTNKISFDSLNNNLIMFIDFIKDKEKCFECKGLEYCVQNKKGYIKELENNCLDHIIKPCSFMRDRSNSLKHKKNIVVNHMSEKQLLLSFNCMDLQGEEKKYIEVIGKILNRIQNGFAKGIYFSGAVGTGKTYLACCLLNHFAKKNKNCTFINIAQFMNELKNNLNDKTEYKRLIRSLQVDILVIDDFASEKVSQWSRDEILFAALNERMEKKKLTFFTSNYYLDNLYEHYSLSKYEDVGSKRLVERIKNLSEEVEVIAKNRRM